MTREEVFLRGTNGLHLSKSRLKDILEKAGFARVGVLVTTANVVLDGDLQGADLEAEVAHTLQQALGSRIDVFVRDHKQLSDILAGNPYRDYPGKHLSYVAAYFMRAPASFEEISALERSAEGEEFKQGVHCLYIKFPRKMRQSKLELPKCGVARHWSTVTAAMVRTEVRRI